MPISLNKSNLKGFLTDQDFDSIAPDVKKAHNALTFKKGKGSEFTGWMELPGQVQDSFFQDLKKSAARVQKNSDALISIGIGGSYLGIRAAEEFLKADVKLPIHYAGQNLSSDYLLEVLSNLKEKDVSVVVISKSGTTTEPALAFRIVKQFLDKKYSKKELKDRIICVTDSKKGALRTIATK